jgi:hypothetical protein
MKRIIFVVLVMIVAIGTSAQADMGDAGVRAGYMRFSEADSGAMMGGLFFRSDWQKIVFVDWSLYYNEKEVAPGIDLELIPIQLSGMLFLLGRDDVFSPFVLGGLGLYWQRMSDGNDSENDFDFGWHLGFGADYKLTDRIFLEADFRYIWLDASSEGQTFGDKLSDFDHWIGTLGIGFRL